MGSDDQCQSVLNDSSWVFSSSALLLVVLVPVHFTLVSWFVRKLMGLDRRVVSSAHSPRETHSSEPSSSMMKRGDRNPLVLSVLLYIVLSSLSICVGITYFWIWPLIQWLDGSPSMFGCSVMIFHSWWLSISSYVSLLMVFYIRLIYAFKDTMYEVNWPVKWMFAGIFSISWLLCTIMITVRTSHMSCWSEYSYGFLSASSSSDIGFYPKTVKYCSVNERKYGWYSRAVPTLSVGSFVICSLSLMYLFVRRLREVISMRIPNDNDHHNNHGHSTRNHVYDLELHQLAIKSSVLCVTGLLSTTVSMLLIPAGFASLVYVDYTLNTFLLSMLFDRTLYPKVFGPLLRCLNLEITSNGHNRLQLERIQGSNTRTSTTNGSSGLVRGATVSV